MSFALLARALGPVVYEYYLNRKIEKLDRKIARLSAIKEYRRDCKDNNKLYKLGRAKDLALFDASACREQREA
jgi:hypothetical protein